MGVVVFIVNFLANENLSDRTQAEMCTDKVIFSGFIHIVLGHVPQLPSSLSDSTGSHSNR